MTKTPIYYYKEKNGYSPIVSFLDSLSSIQQAKTLRIFQTIKEYGLQSALAHIRHITGTQISEIRILGKDNIRILYITKKPIGIIILHGFIKKTQKTPTKELHKAIQRLHNWDTMQSL